MTSDKTLTTYIAALVIFSLPFFPPIIIVVIVVAVVIVLPMSTPRSLDVRNIGV